MLIDISIVFNEKITVLSHLISLLSFDLDATFILTTLMYGLTITPASRCNPSFILSSIKVKENII